MDKPVEEMITDLERLNIPLPPLREHLKTIECFESNIWRMATKNLADNGDGTFTIKLSHG